MNLFEEFDKTFKEYLSLKIVKNDEQLTKEMYNYVYFSNKLEGNKLSLSQTTTLLVENITSGNLPLRDYLEAKGHFKALKFIVSAGLNKYPLTDKILKQANELTLSAYWAVEDSYPFAKSNNQELGAYKIVQNKVLWELDGLEGEFEPNATPTNVAKKIQELFENFSNSKEHIIRRTAYLAYQIYVLQPFCDGNKRTARLMTTFTSLKEGLPLISFDLQAKNNDFNRALLNTFVNKDQKFIEEFLLKEYITSMIQLIEKSQKGKTNHNFRFLI